MQNYTELSLEEIKKLLTEQQLQILELYLKREKQSSIIELTGCTRGQIDALVKKFKLTRFRSRNNYTINEDCLSLKNPELWYFLGWFASDGNIHNTNSGSEIIQFTLKDEEPLQHLKHILSYTGDVKLYSKKGKTNFKYIENKEVIRDYYFLGITNKKLVTLIKEVFPNPYNKTKTLNFPNIPNEDCLRMFIRGFWDGDGCFSVCDSKFYLEAHCASKDFTEGFVNSLNNMNFKTYSYAREGCFDIRISSTVAKDFCKWLYQKQPNMCLTRKYEKALSVIER